ncbi:Stp1/IreP family PP2C-type Ser/Thr phosphatase [Candidatus Clostridium radicumherbarum]|uniref:Stp1/IreP family PP2C-type Ser/Thr phosphatase n=1 Tax=Candidatus Clostridium radicumherbarum TaxID=3381662 RepID=A0ABW8TRZ8_9CLOT
MIGMLSDIGNIRKVNEDFVGFHEDSNKKLYVIADGMGGHNAGEIASKIAVENTIEFVFSAELNEQIEILLKQAIEASNNKIYEVSKTDLALKGMGTTITACLVTGNEMVVANVGDSRCYILENDNFHQITNDHSLVQELVDNGSITEEEAAIHPNKNVITRALGTAAKVEIDIFSADLSSVSKVLLCTDGLTNSLTKEEIYEIITNNDCETSCIRLIELSKERGGRDNISVIIFEGECNDGRDFTK